MKLAAYLDMLCWSQKELARKANISVQVVNRAINGEKVARRSALAIAETIASATGKKMIVSDIEGLEVVALKHRKKGGDPKKKA